ncbi:MAG TPA: RpiB/LacA/LacB family sugar-phosphate isomerase [Anaerolineaceae bacterium]|nr:RpiB/LacA/LacB family sugar-phosphate isomerase [Anaerolineaceae bacterium]HPT23513.1 RpiB/LacA/LacB family sugar-phosphate isomerase [Anaerolineaceae bacterium]
MTTKTIVIGCDNAAVGLKQELIKVMEQEGVAYEDVGVTDTSDQTYYPLVAERVCQAIIASGYQKEGILICGTGLGMAITANKFPGILAGVCHDSFSAERLRLSNDGNLLCMGARVIGPELAKKILREWLSLQYKPDGPSQPKVDAMRAIDEQHRK